MKENYKYKKKCHDDAIHNKMVTFLTLAKVNKKFISNVHINQ